MAEEETTPNSMFEDKIRALEVALFLIGEAMLKPDMWQDEQRLHQHIYDTAKRGLRGSNFGVSLESIERELQRGDAADPPGEA